MKKPKPRPIECTCPVEVLKFLSVGTSRNITGELWYCPKCGKTRRLSAQSKKAPPRASWEPPEAYRTGVRLGNGGEPKKEYNEDDPRLDR